MWYWLWWCVCLNRWVTTARKLWKSYFPSVDAVVYLIDANDKERFPEARKELDVRMGGWHADSRTIVVHCVHVVPACLLACLRCACMLTPRTTSISVGV